MAIGYEWLGPVMIIHGRTTDAGAQKTASLCRNLGLPFDVLVEGGQEEDRQRTRSSTMAENPTRLDGAVSCHCGRPATHLVSNGVVTLRTCYLHAHKAAVALKAA